MKPRDGFPLRTEFRTNPRLLLVARKAPSEAGCFPSASCRVFCGVFCDPPLHGAPRAGPLLAGSRRQRALASPRSSLLPVLCRAGSLSPLSVNRPLSGTPLLTLQSRRLSPCPTVTCATAPLLQSVLALESLLARAPTLTVRS